MIRPTLAVLALGIGLGLAQAVSAQAPDAREAELKRLREALALVSEEQRSLFQQFQMVQALVRGVEPPQPGITGPVYSPPAAPPNYEDLVREREARERKRAEYQVELDRLYARYRDLEERKAPLIERIGELSRGG